MLPRFCCRFIPALFLILLSPALCGQQLRFEQFTTRNGLPSNEIFTLLQDHYGYIWICTNYGMVKYNGEEFIPVCSNIPISEQFAYCMYEDHEGTMWFANSRANIFYIRNDSAFMIEGIDQISEKLRNDVNEIIHLSVDDSLNIYISAKNENYKFIKSKSYEAQNLKTYYSGKGYDLVILKIKKSLQPIRLNKPESGKKMKILLSDQDSKNNYLYEIISPEFPRNIIKSNEYLSFIAGNKLFRIDKNNNHQSVTFPEQLVALTEGPDHHLWIGSYNGGLYEIDETGKILHHYFKETSAYYILFDNQDGMWVSTGQGLFHCSNIHDIAYDNINGLSKRIAFVKQTGPYITVVTSKNKIYRISDSILEVNFTNSLPEITSLEATETGYIISTRSGIYTCDHLFRNLVQTNLLSSFSIVKKEKAYYFLNRKEIRKNDSPLTLNIPSKANHFLLYDENTFIIATDEGVYFADINLNKSELLTCTGGITINRIAKNRKEHWCATKAMGLLRIGKNKQCTTYTTPGKIIYDIHFIHDTLVTIFCNNGTYINSIQNLERDKPWRNLTDAESFSGTTFENHLYIGTSEGLICIDLESDFYSHNTPFYLQKISSGKINSENVYIMDYDQNNPEFYFEYLNYHTRDKKLYYLLTGEITKSGIADGLNIRFENLPPGNYSLSVTPYLYTSDTRNKIIINFKINAPYWTKWWFIILLSASISLFTAAIVILIFKRIKTRAQKKEEISRMLAEYKLIALKAQINPHFISNSLTAIQLLILANNTDKAGLYIAKFSHFIRTVLQYSDKSFIPLSEELKMIELNIELEMLRFNNAFEYSVRVDPNIDISNTLVPPMITQPLIENAIWHGLLPLKEERSPKLQIDITRKEKRLCIVIADNGKGRKPRTDKHESKGIELTLKRIENTNLLLGVNTASFLIEDLKNTDGIGIGTKVIIELPEN